MTFYKIRMELAREPRHPEGSRNMGYEFVAPVKEGGELDLAAWRQHRERCIVRRFWHGEPERHGHLTHNGTHWKFHYPGDDPDEDDPIYKLGAHKLLTGEYISIDEDDGETHTFRIVRTEKLPV